MRVVAEMVESCAEHDGAPPRIHWPLATVRRRGLTHQVAISDGEVVGYACAYRFDPGDPEVCIVVDPAWRRRGIGTNLWRALAPLVGGWGLESFIGFVPRSAAGEDGFIPPGGVPGIVDLTMRCGRVRPRIEELAPVELREVTIDDFETLAELDAESFGSEPRLTAERLHQHHDGVTRRAWLAYVGEELVGKIHVRVDEDASYVHDLCIRPSARGGGYGISMVAQVTAMAIGSHPSSLAALDVEGPNVVAVGVYEKVGYETAASWRVVRWQTDARVRPTAS